jgi:uncharacterized protein YbcI
MKGTFFKKPLEFNIDINGETWAQGDTISGKFSITEHTKIDFDRTILGCHLCYCTNKKFKSKDPKAITVLESQHLLPNQNELNFTFNLEANCKISDTTGSLYIIYGDISNPFDSGFLELNVTPIKPILYFTQIFEQFYRFKLKAFKNKKGYIEASVAAPDSKEWAGVKKMSIQMHIKDDELIVQFNVNLTKLDFTNSLNKTKDEKKEITKTLTKKQYDLYGIANQDGIKKVIDEVLSEIKIKPII